MPLSENHSILVISNAMNDGIERLKKVKSILDKIKERERYNLSDIILSEEKGRIDFNFHWFKLFVRIKLIARIDNNSIGRNKFHFEHNFIWGKYGLEVEHDIVKDNVICNSSQGLLFTRGTHIPELENIDECIPVVDEIILECIPDTLIHYADDEA